MYEYLLEWLERGIVLGLPGLEPITVRLGREERKRGQSELARVEREFADGLEENLSRPMKSWARLKSALETVHDEYGAVIRIQPSGHKLPIAKTLKRKPPLDPEKILSVLRAASKPLNRQQIARKLRCNYQRLIRLMYTLREAGKVVSTGNGYYTVPNPD